MDRHLLDILCCPVSRVALRLVNALELAALNRAIDAGELLSTAGVPVKVRLNEALITVDGKVIYRVDDGIPVMLPEEGIAAAQLAGFPAGT